MEGNDESAAQDIEDRWDDSFLDSMREIGDPLADDAVLSLMDRAGIEEVHRLMSTLVVNDYDHFTSFNCRNSIFNLI